MSPTISLFGLSQLIYWFLLYYPSEEPSMAALVVKCLPVACLAFSVFLEVEANQPLKVEGWKISKWIMTGLIWSVVGDACLVYPTFFELGVVAFGIAHCYYIKALGFQPLNITGGIVLYSLVGVYLGLLVMPRLPDLLSWIGMPIYFTLLTTTAWRALARAWWSPAEPWGGAGARYLTAIGAVLFVISDCLIVYNLYVQQLQAQQLLIMSTYYAAQFLISLSANQAISEATIYTGQLADEYFKGY